MLFLKGLVQIRSFFTSRPNRGKVRRFVDLAFGKYLLVTNITHCGLLMGLGDLMQQEMEYQRELLPKRYDYTRLTQMTIIGGIAFGPMHHYFYIYLNTLYPKRTLRSVTIKILIDQIIMSPISIASLFYGMAALESKSLEKANEQFKHEFWSVYTVDWAIWGPTQYINFSYVPAVYQVLFINIVCVLYDVCLSYFYHKPNKEHKNK